MATRKQCRKGRFDLHVADLVRAECGDMVVVLPSWRQFMLNAATCYHELAKLRREMPNILQKGQHPTRGKDYPYLTKSQFSDISKTIQSTTDGTCGFMIS